MKEPKLKELKLAQKLADISDNLANYARDVEAMFEQADFCDRMVASAGLAGLEADVPYWAIAAGTHTETTRKQLAKFDKQLANLILIRGQLAEITHIPMFHRGVGDF